MSEIENLDNIMPADDIPLAEVSNESEPAPQEMPRMFTQEEVDRMLHSERKLVASKVREATREKLEQQYLSEIEKLKSEGALSGAGPKASDSELASQILNTLRQELDARDEAKREAEQQRLIEQAQAEYAQDVEQKAAKLRAQFEEAAASPIYDDFNEVLGKLNYRKFGKTALNAANFDNAADILYELTKTPGQLLDMERMLETDEEMGNAYLKELSEEVKKKRKLREENANVNNQPLLKRAKSDPLGGGSGTRLSMEELKKRYIR
jgi:hypothetical protein